MTGWVKLHRQLLDNPIVMKDAEHLAVWTYLLLKATHIEYNVIFNNKRIILMPGQLITGRKSIASSLKINESKVQRILKLLENEQQIEQQTSNQNRLITIVNWGIYQESEQQIEQQTNNERTTSEQQVNTNKNIKNIKNIKNKDIENIKHKFGEFNHVRLKEKESNKLIDELGKETFDKCIKKLDEYIQETGKKYKDHNLTIRRWVIKAVKEDAEKGKVQKTNNKFINFEQREYDFEAIEKKAMKMVLEENKR